MPLSALKPERVRRVLLISATALGDTLFSTPAIRALKERYPAWELEVLGHRVFGALLAHNPHVARVWAYPGRNRRLLRLIQELKGRHYDLVIILHGNDPEATMVAYLTGAPYIIGSAGSPLSFAYAARVAPPADPMTHAIERRLDYVRLLGADTPDKRMDLFLTPAELDEAEAILAAPFWGAAPITAGPAPHRLRPLQMVAGGQLRRVGEFFGEDLPGAPADHQRRQGPRGR